MKKYIYIIIGLAAAATVAVSCNDMLDRYPKSQLGADAYFNTREDLQLFSNSFYNNLLEKTPYSTQSDVYVTNNLADRLQCGTAREVPKSGGSWSWGDLRKMNTLLGNMYRCSDEDAVKEYTGLVKFFRAYFYFDKVKKFGDVPWIDRELGSADEELYYPRDSREVIMNHMIEDIDEAIANLPEKKHEKATRVNKWVALALKARFCLFEGTFRKYHNITGYEHDADYFLNLAVQACEEIMTNGNYSLYDTDKPAQDYHNLFASVDAVTKEVMLCIHYDQAMGVKHDATKSLLSNTAKPGMTKKMVDMYLMSDGTRFTDKPGWELLGFKEEVAGRDPRLAQTIWTPGYTWKGNTSMKRPDFQFSQTGYQPIKYIQDDGGAIYSDQSYNDMPCFRYAEVLLNYAEAKAELSSSTLSQTDLDNSINLIRDRAGMPNLNLSTANSNPDDNYLGSARYGFTNVTGPNKGIILEIRRERAVELFEEGEGRFFDLMRWKAGNCISQEMDGMYIDGPGEYDFDGDGVKEYVFYQGTKPNVGSNQTAIEISTTPGTTAVVLRDPANPANVGVAKGTIDVMNTIPHIFDENRDYFYPIPIDDRSLNHNLTQNPGWVDGLGF